MRAHYACAYDIRSGPVKGVLTIANYILLADFPMLSANIIITGAFCPSACCLKVMVHILHE